MQRWARRRIWGEAGRAVARARPGSARDTAWETAVWAAGGGGAAASAPRARGDRGSRKAADGGAAASTRGGGYAQMEGE